MYQRIPIKLKTKEKAASKRGKEHVTFFLPHLKERVTADSSQDTVKNKRQ